LEEFVTALSIEVAHPTRTETLLGCCQTEMLHCNSDVDIAMRLLVSAHPLLVLHDGCKDIERCLVEPRAMIARTKLLNSLCTTNDAELPRLQVDSRRSQSHTLLKIEKLFFLYGLVKICPTAVTVANNVN
jgi:hypothetical protein